MYPHVGVDASGLATLRATVATIKETLRGLVPTAYAVPAFVERGTLGMDARIGDYLPDFHAAAAHG
ncbi:RNA polymerase subunit sigma-24, partial [Streptomyces sp. NPDC048304]